MSKLLNTLKKMLLAYESRSLIDSVLLLITCGIVFYYVRAYDLAERYFEFAQSYESLELDEVPIALSICLVFVILFTYRRLQDLRSKIVLANMDSLAEIFNRRKGEELLKAQVKYSNLYNSSLALIMIDIDDFKQINDGFGHDVGDFVLKSVIKLVQGIIRRGDILIRWGGEEFIILCPQLDKKLAKQLANRIRVAIMEHRFSVVGDVTASFGVTEYDLCEDASAFLTRADTLLYKSKEQGKNRVSD